MSMIEVKTAELVGPALDWAVGIAEGWEPDRPQDGQLRKTWLGCTQYMIVGRGAPCGGGNSYSPSTDWSQGGPLIEKYRISLVGPGVSFGRWGADILGSELIVENSTADSPLVAACRRLVREKLGYAVQVPAQLAGA